MLADALKVNQSLQKLRSVVELYVLGVSHLYTCHERPSFDACRIVVILSPLQS